LRLERRDELFALDFRAVDFRVVLRADDFRAVDFRAVDLRAVDLRAVDFRAVLFRVVLFRRVVVFFARLVPVFRLLDLRAVDFRAVDLRVVLRADDFRAVDLRLLDAVLRELVFRRPVLERLPDVVFLRAVEVDFRLLVPVDFDRLVEDFDRLVARFLVRLAALREPLRRRRVVFASPVSARCLFTVRAASSSAVSVGRPLSWYESLMYSYCRSRSGLNPSGISSSLRGLTPATRQRYVSCTTMQDF